MKIRIDIKEFKKEFPLNLFLINAKKNIYGICQIDIDVAKLKFKLDEKQFLEVIKKIYNVELKKEKNVYIMTQDSKNI